LGRSQLLPTAAGKDLPRSSATVLGTTSHLRVICIDTQDDVVLRIVGEMEHPSSPVEQWRSRLYRDVAFSVAQVASA
jgi:hypothetical protein